MDTDHQKLDAKQQIAGTWDQLADDLEHLRKLRANSRTDA
jgi:hypothetical protein